MTTTFPKTAFDPANITESDVALIAHYVFTQFPDATAEQRTTIGISLMKGETEICVQCSWLKDMGADCDFCYAAALEAEADSRNDDDDEYNRHATLYPQF